MTDDELIAKAEKELASLTMCMSPDEVAKLEAHRLIALARIGASVMPRPIVTVLEMKTSAGSDHYVQVKCGTRSLTPYMSKIKGRAEYSAAEFEWLLNGGEKPRLGDWLDRTAEPALPKPAEVTT